MLSSLVSTSTSSSIVFSAYLKYLCYCFPIGGKPLPYNTSSSEFDDLPDQFDWRLYGAITPVKDQSICGSCWSFGTIGAIEGAFFLHNGGNLVRLSQQALIDCSWGYGNNGCDGGEDFRAYQWMLKMGGVPTEEEYGGYLGQDGYCHVQNVSLTAKINGWVNVSQNCFVFRMTTSLC